MRFIGLLVLVVEFDDEANLVDGLHVIFDAQFILLLLQTKNNIADIRRLLQTFLVDSEKAPELEHLVHVLLVVVDREVVDFAD